jgi:peptide chain release factor 1
MNTILNQYNWPAIITKITELNALLQNTKNDLRKIGEIRKEIAFLEFILTFKNKLEELYTKNTSIDLELINNSNEPDLLQLFAIEKEEIQIDIKSLEKELEENTFHVDEKNSRSAFVEIRAGAGGQEASLFVSDLARMYTMYGQKKNWQTTITDTSTTDVGGFREIIMHIEGKNVFKFLHFESGVHRVQRVPSTENAGRVHTSTVTVAVLPEVEEVEIIIDDKDLRIDTYRAGGAGGQHVNKTDSAVRITHIPTNTVVQCQDERSQHKNKSRAMKALKSKLFILEKEKQDAALSKTRKDMVSGAERAEKIRTYNYPQNRITDHRANITLNQLDFILNGDMDTLIDLLLEDNKKNKSIHKYLIDFVSL